MKSERATLRPWIAAGFLVMTSLAGLVVGSSSSHFQAPSSVSSPAGRLADEVLAHGQQMKYLTLLSDEIGSRLTGTPAARRAIEAMEAEMKRLGLANVRRESFSVPVSWKRGPAAAVLTSGQTSAEALAGCRPAPCAGFGYGDRPLTVASYTWSPGTAGPVEGELVNLGLGRPEDIRRAGAKLQGAIALVTLPSGTLDELIASFYRTPLIAREIQEAGGRALFIASDKQHAMLYTAPVDFQARLAALPTLSLAREDAGLLERLLARGEGQNQRRALAGSRPAPQRWFGQLRVSLEVSNTLGPAFESDNVVGEIPGRERPEEIVVLGAHLDSNDLGPGALDNAAGSAGVMETARAILALGLAPRRTIRFVLFTGEEEGMLGSTAYVRRHRDEMDRTVAAIIMDIGAGRPQGWFSMGRSDLDGQIRELVQPLRQFDFGSSAGPVIEHAAFAATDNAAFMAEGVPNLVMLQDEAPYIPVHHTVADTPDKADPRDFSSAVALLAATAFEIADRNERFGRRLTAQGVKKMAKETGVDAQWRAAGIWP